MAVAAAVPYIPATRRKRKAPAPVGFADFSNPLSPKFMHSVKTLRRPRSSDPHGLGSADIKRLLLQYSLPAIIGNVVTSLYHLVDSIFIGHGIGALALSGMAVTFPIMNILAAFSTMIGVGGATLTSIRLGRKDQESARAILWHVALANTVNSVILGALCLLFLDPVLRIFGASGSLLPAARDFMSIYLCGVPVNFVFLGLNNLMRVSGYPNKAMLSSFLTVAINMALAPVFIFVLGWGLKGAALATVLAQFSGLIWVLIHFSGSKSFVRFGKKAPEFSFKLIGEILAIGISPFLMNLVSSFVISLINVELIRYGGDFAVGAYGIINRIIILFVFILIGITMGMQPIVGYNFGAKQMDRAFQALKYAVVMGVIITVAGVLFAELFPHLIIGMFTTHAELSELSVMGLRLAIIGLPLAGVQIPVSNFFQSIGKVKISIFLSLTRQLIFLIPALLLLPLFLGLRGVFMSLPVADIVAFLVTVGTFTYQYRKIKRIPL